MHVHRAHRGLRLLAAVVTCALAEIATAGPSLAAPAAPVVVAAPSSPGLDRTPTWSFAADPGATFECRVRRGLLDVQPWAGCASPATIDLTAALDGAYDFEVRALVGALLSPSTSSTYRLDTTPPDPVGLTGAATGNDATPAFTISAPGATETIYDATLSPLPPAMPSIAYAARSSAEVGDLVAFGGSKRYVDSVTVTLEDWAMHSDYPTYPAGAWQHPITLNLYAVDRTGGAPAVGPLLASVTQVASIPWRPEPDPTCPASGPFVGYRAGDGQCYFSVPANVTFGLSPSAVDLPGEVIVGVAFNTQGSGAAPTGVSGPYNSLNLAVSSAGPSRGADVEPDAIFYNSTFGGFYADGGAGGTGSFRRDTGWSPYTPAIQVVAVDPPGPAATTECRLSTGPAEVSTWAACATPIGYDLTSLADGTYTVAVRPVDGAGNVGPATTFDYTLDRSVPAAPSITSGPISPGTDRTPTWSFVSDPSASLECRVTDGGVTAPGWASCVSPAAFDLTARGDGEYRFEVRARNPLGTVGAAATRDFTLDTIAPAAPLITSSVSSPGSDRNPTWAFTAELGATTECQVERGATVVAAWAACGSPSSYDLVGMPTGSYRFGVRARDAAGNQGPTGWSDYTLETVASTAPEPSEPASSGSRTPPHAGPALDPSPVPAAPIPTPPRSGGQPDLVPPGPNPEPAGDRRPLILRLLAAIFGAALRNPDKSFFPASLVLMVAGFLTVQDRIDRRDPKLALAPVYPDPDLDFPAAPRSLS